MIQKIGEKENKILLVEDSEPTNTLIKNILKRKGYNITQCYTGKEALEKIQDETFSLLLIDYVLPDIKGDDFVREMKKTPPFLPFVVITGYGNERISVELMKEGAIDYVVKETGFEETLPKIVENALYIVNIRRELENSQKKLEESEKKFRYLAENIQDMVVLTKTGTIIYSNASFENFFGKKRNKLEDIIAQVHTHETTKGTKSLIEKHSNQPTSLEGIFEKKNGKKRWLWMRSVPIRSENNEEPLVYTIFSDIEEKKDMEQKILKSVIEAEENEKMRFSRELHDGIGPLLSALKLYINTLSTELTIEKKREMMIDAKSIIDEAIESSREIASRMMPSVLSDFGLTTALQTFFSKIRKTGQYEIVEKYSQTEGLDNVTTLTIYRIVQELTTNTMKHSGADGIMIDLERGEREIELTYRDNGRGIKTSEKQWTGQGFKNMRNRVNSLNGSVIIEKNQREGFEIRISIPYKKNK